MNGRLAAVAVLALALTLSACGGNQPTSATISTSRLEVVSWWTSSSEAKALGVLFAAFRDSNPGVHAINGAIRGGAGSNAIVALAKRLQRNDPPDVWQTFAGNSLQAYASNGVVRSVASIFAREHLRTEMNATILESLMYDGQPYGVPTGAHRSNVLFFNLKLLAKAGVPPPSNHTTLGEFLTVPKEGQGFRSRAALPRGQRPVHHGRAVREHAAQLDRAARVEGRC